MRNKVMEKVNKAGCLVVTYEAYEARSGEVARTPSFTEKFCYYFIVIRIEIFKYFKSYLIDMVPDLVKIKRTVEPALEGRSCFTEDNRLSPFLNPPHDGLRPGVMGEALFKFHELYAEVFTEKAGFIGAGIHGSSIDQKIWAEEFDLVFLQNGHFDDRGNFHAPIAAYRAKLTPASDLVNRLYVLFQQGNYRVFPESYRDYIEKGKLIVYRGIGGRTKFINPQIGDERQERYKEYLAYSFASPLFALSYNHVSRAETDHVKRFNMDSPPLCRLYNYRSDFKDLEQSFSTSKIISSGKFGPSFVSFETPLDNLRIITEWTGEGEVRILYPGRTVRVK